MERRDTAQRQAILSALRREPCHPTADEIYEEVRRTIPRISKGTVYRNLKVLQEMGLVTELKLDGVVSRYEYRKDRHYHFRCEDCGQVLDIPVAVDADLDARIAAATGLEIHGHQLEFRGRCPACQAAQKKE